MTDDCELNRVERIRVRRPLLVAAEVVHHAHSHALERDEIGWREFVQRVGPENLPPDRVATVRGWVAAEIAEVLDTLELETARMHRDKVAPEDDREANNR